MSRFERQVGNAISETRILVLGTQVLVGAAFSTFFQSAFPPPQQGGRLLALFGLALLLGALALLLSPATFHRVAERGRATSRYLLFVRRVAGVALVPLALGLSAHVALAAGGVAGPRAGFAAGSAALLLPAALWYGPFLARRGRPPRPTPEEHPDRPLDQRIDHLLAEIRVVLPGAQALLGFQLTICFVPAFRELPAGARLLHLASLGFVALATVLLITPAAVHRIVEEGNPTEKFLALAARFLVGAMVPLALGLSSDLAVVVWKVMESRASAIVWGAAALVTFTALWFAFPLLKRAPA